MSELHKAKMKVMEAIGYVQKTGKTDQRAGGYNYLPEAELLRKVRPELVENGISVAPTEVIPLDETKTGNGTPIARILVTYTFTHDKSGDAEPVMVVGCGMDKGDKHYNKAMTVALKYAIRQWLILETGDDPDIVHEYINDEPMSEMLRAAVKKIEACRTADATADQMDKIRHAEKQDGSGEPLFSEVQLTELDRMAARHIEKMGAK